MGCLSPRRAELFSPQGPHPEAVPCALQHLQGGQTGWPSRCTRGGEGRGAVGVVSPRSHTQRPELVFLGRAWGVSHESGAFGLVSTHTGECSLHFPLSDRPSSWAFIVAGFISGPRNPGPSTSPLLPLPVLSPPPAQPLGRTRVEG